MQDNCLSRFQSMLPLLDLHCLAEVGMLVMHTRGQDPFVQFASCMLQCLFVQLGLEGNPIAFHPQYRLLVVHNLSTLLAPLQVSFS